MKTYTIFKTAIIVGLIFGLSGAIYISGAIAEEGKPSAHAVAVLHPTADSQVSGIVTFSKAVEGVRIVADVKGLAPGKHGFHIHQWGDCSASDGKSAGGHFNPMGQSHSGPMDKVRHVGDLGNIEARSDGKAHYDRVDEVISLGGPDGIVGRAVIVHAGTDDMKSQPTGAAGARAACGVIGWAK